jgi:hypothetical protein
MRILQISTYDLESGAARAAYRLHKGLRQLGQDCSMVVRYKSSADESVLEVTATFFLMGSSKVITWMRTGRN